MRFDVKEVACVAGENGEGEGEGEGERERGEKIGVWELGTRERLRQNPHFFISAAASGCKILIG